MKKLLFILMLGSLFADIGVGFHIQSVPKISIPIKLKKIIIEPSIELSSTKFKDDFFQETQFGPKKVTLEDSYKYAIFTIGLYRLFPINSNLNILGGFNGGFLTPNNKTSKISNVVNNNGDLLNQSTRINDYRTLISLNLGFSYKLNDNFHLGYELVNKKIFFTGLKNERSQSLSSEFIVRFFI